MCLNRQAMLPCGRRVLSIDNHVREAAALFHVDNSGWRPLRFQGTLLVAEALRSRRYSVAVGSSRVIFPITYPRIPGPIK